MSCVSELMGSLPEHLSERTYVPGDGEIKRGQFVVYWLRTAMRVQENPALDVALLMGQQLELPVFVYQGLSERYPFASDRLHTFMLQGARDLQRQCQRRDIGYTLHVERPGHRGPHLKTLAARAAIVITEEMPVDPLRRWTHTLRGCTETPVVTVDTACVMPMRLVGRAYDRAFQFRNATREEYAHRVKRPWTDAPRSNSLFLPPDLPFEPMDLSRRSIPQLVAECDIDHTVGPVPHTIGGSEAGDRRWEAFRRGALTTYDQHRNDALRSAVSRMSPYLHFGMVSPLRVAREAAETGGHGGEKYLDELLIWREMAYAFCLHCDDHDQISALPDWAQETLETHRSDQRPALYSWETLSRGRTGDTLWDAAQRSLLIHGELHNNVRMTWGKSLLQWTADVQSALSTMIDLNHRYALDGRDPASYGGMLWCLGQFDRPFPPERPVFGTVRERSTHAHSTRLDPHAFMRKTTRPLCDSMPTVAIIGGGMSGLMCGRTLTDHGFEVRVLEKSRGVGGRMATRRTPESWWFDHGAQYFTVRHEQFQRFVQSWIHDGLVREWSSRIVVLQDGAITQKQDSPNRYVAVPTMNAICRHLASSLDVTLRTRVAVIRPHAGQWQLTDEHGEALGEFGVVISTAPAAQTAELLSGPSPRLADAAGHVTMHPCWAVMVVFPTALSVEFDGAFVHGSPLSWMARDSSKPGRQRQLETWVLHASPEWSAQHLDLDHDDVASRLLAAFWQAIDQSPVTAHASQAHRWRYALPPEPIIERCLFDAEQRLGACGDWCGGPRVEGAFLSGAAMAGRVMGLLAATASAS